MPDTEKESASPVEKLRTRLDALAAMFATLNQSPPSSPSSSAPDDEAAGRYRLTPKGLAASLDLPIEFPETRSWNSTVVAVPIVGNGRTVIC